MNHQSTPAIATRGHESKVHLTKTHILRTEPQIVTSAAPQTLPQSRGVSPVDNPIADSTRLLIPRKPLPSIQCSARTRLLDPASEISSRRAHVIRNWWMEIAACSLFLVALTAIVATLYPHQGKPLPQWPYQISVNSLISIYVVVLKGTILLVTAEGLGQLKWRWFREDRPLDDLVRYDEATRGPLGALRLLWRLRLQHPLSSTGALITLAVLTIDPFTQQIIHYYDCSVPVIGSEASIPRTNVIDQVVEGGASNWREYTMKLRNALDEGISSQDQPVNAVCPTGNCTFEKKYGTLGYCSSCTDVTNDLTIHSTYVKSNYTDWSITSGFSENGTNVTLNETFDSFLDNTNISISTSLPSGLTVSVFPGSTFNLAAMQAFQDTINLALGYSVEIIVGKQFILFDPATGLPPTGCDTAATNDTWLCRGYGAARCSLSPCVRIYESKVVAGELHETCVATSNSIERGWGQSAPPASSPIYEPYFGLIDTLCLSADSLQSLSTSGYNIDSDSRWLAYNLTDDPQYLANHTSFLETMLANGCLYAISEVFNDVLWTRTLVDFFQGIVVGQADNFPSSLPVLNRSQNLQTLYNFGNVSFDRINSTFDHLSDTMTDFVRQRGSKNYSKPAQGTVWRDQTCLSVRWQWLAVPTSLVVLTLVFFVAMVIHTRPTRERAAIWKSSPLALLFHGLEIPDKHHNPVDDIDGMEDATARMTVKLSSTDNGLKFVETKDEKTNCK